MSDPDATTTRRPRRAPVWLIEGLDIVEQRRGVLLGVLGLVVALGAVLALVAPGVVPPVPVVGTAVAVAGILLGIAAAVAADTTDLMVRGPRHVGAAGGELVAVLPTTADPAAASELAAAVFEAREPGEPLLLGLAAVGRDVRPIAALTDALAVALVRTGVSVLRLDLASGRSRPPGLIDVVRGDAKLIDAVTFEPGLRLARLGAGEDHVAALQALSTLPERLPKDLDVLLVALPTAASRPVVTAVRSLDHVLLVAQRDRTARVDLIAALDALEAAGTQAQVALLDDRTGRRLGLTSAAATGAAPAPESTVEPVDDDPGGEPAVDDDPVDEPVDDGTVGLAVQPSAAGPSVTADDLGAAGSDQQGTLEPERAQTLPPEPVTDEGVADPPTADVESAPASPDPAPEVPEDRDARQDPPTEPAASEPRDVAIMLGAREAAAEALARTPPTPPFVASPPDGGTGSLEPIEREPIVPEPIEPEPIEPEPTEPEPTDAEVSDEPVAGEALLASDAEAADEPEVQLALLPDEDEDEDTDEIPAVHRPPPVRQADHDRDELLRTTAQLAHLMDDLDVRDVDERQSAERHRP